MVFWNKLPFIKLLIPFALGISIALNYGVNFPVFNILLLPLLGILTVRIKNYNLRWIKGVAICILVFAFGFQLVEAHKDINQSNHYHHHIESSNYVFVKLISAPSTKEKSVRFEGEVTHLHDEELKSVSGRLLMYLQQDSLAHSLKRGDFLLIPNKIKPVDPPINPHQFNYKRYLFFHSTYNQVYLRSNEYQKLNYQDKNLFNVFDDLREYLMRVLKNHGLKNKEFSVASALILGQRDYLGHELVHAYSSAGAMHVLAVSGLHVGILFLVFSSLFKFLLRFKHGQFLYSIILLLLLWCYACLTGFSPSVTRASTMFSFIIVGKALNRGVSTYNIVGASAFVLLVFNPFYIVEVGFQLSYLAVLGIIFLQPKIYHLITIPTWLGDKIWAITAVSISAQVATFPLGLLYFHQFPNYFLLSNLIVIPAAMLILYGGLLLFVVSPLPVLSDLVGQLLNLIIYLLNKGVDWINSIQYSLAEGISITTWECWLIYLSILFLILGFTNRKARHVKLGLITLAVLFSYRVYVLHQQYKQHQFIVYSAGNFTALDFIQGRENIFIADPELTSDRGTMLFNVRNNWDAMGLRNPTIVNSKNSQIKADFVKWNKDFIQFGGQRILLLDDTSQLHQYTQKLKLDWIILTKNAPVKISELKNCFEFDLIIFDSSNSYWKKEYWKLYAQQGGIEIYDVKEKGAFIFDF